MRVVKFDYWNFGCYNSEFAYERSLLHTATDQSKQPEGLTFLMNLFFQKLEFRAWLLKNSRRKGIPRRGTIPNKCQHRCYKCRTRSLKILQCKRLYLYKNKKSKGWFIRNICLSFKFLSSLTWKNVFEHFLQRFFELNFFLETCQALSVNFIIVPHVMGGLWWW